MKPFVTKKLQAYFDQMRQNPQKLPENMPAEMYALTIRKAMEAAVKQLPVPNFPMKSVCDVPIPPDADTPENWVGMVRFFTPANCVYSEAGPLIVDIHGGGFTAGSVESMQGSSMRTAFASGYRVASVEYRLAPEYKFPIGLNDVVRSLKYIFAHADELKVDPDKIILTGGSAGANLLVAASMILRDEGHRMPRALMPMVGAFADFETPSFKRFYEDGVGLSGHGVEKCMKCYLESPEQRQNPLVSPIRGDLRGLPLTYVFAAALDPLFDDSLELVKAMRAQDQECYLIEMLSTAHGGMPFGLDEAYYNVFVHVARTLMEN